MLTAFLWGTGAAVSLLVGSLIVLKWDIPCRVVGLVMAFGGGVLISAVSFELVDEAIHLDKNHLLIASGFLLGSLTFFIGNLLLEKIWQLPPVAAAFTMTFVGGALLTMLADAMMPEAYRDTGAWAGVVTACGFGVAHWLSRLV